MKKICFFIILVLVCGCVHNKDRVRINLKDETETIRCIVLAHTPVGAHSDDVQDFINKKLIRGDYVSADTPAYYDKRQGISSTMNGKKGRIGTRSIVMRVGGYGRNLSTLFLVTTWVYVGWGFDENDRLLDVVVVKENDGP